MSKREKTKYPGVYFRYAKRIGNKGKEKVYYIVFKKYGKTIEEKVGRQYADNITSAKASYIRAERIEGKRLSRKETKKLKVETKCQQDSIWTINRLWEEYKKMRPYTVNLKIDDCRYNKYISHSIGFMVMSEITILDIETIRSKLEKDKAPQTVRHVLNLVKRIVNFGVKRQLCKQLNFHIDLPRVNNLVTEDLSNKQLNKLIRVLEEDSNIQVANMLFMVLFTGMRRGELFKLKWEDVDFEREFIHIRNPKGGLDQKIPLNVPAKRMLEQHPRTDSDYIFPGKNGQQRVDCKKAVNRIKGKAELPNNFRPFHGLRHFFASNLASSGKVDMYTLQKLLTHKNPRTTQRYAHMRDEALRNASNLAGKLFNDNLNNQDYN